MDDEEMTDLLIEACGSRSSRERELGWLHRELSDRIGQAERELAKLKRMMRAVTGQ